MSIKLRNVLAVILSLIMTVLIMAPNSYAVLKSNKSWGDGVTDAALNKLNGTSYYKRLPGVNMYACVGYAEWAFKNVYKTSPTVPSYSLVRYLRGFFISKGAPIVAYGSYVSKSHGGSGKFVTKGEIQPGDVVFFFKRGLQGGKIKKGAIGGTRGEVNTHGTHMWTHVAIISGSGSGINAKLHHNSTGNPGIAMNSSIKTVLKSYSSIKGATDYQVFRLLQPKEGYGYIQKSYTKQKWYNKTPSLKGAKFTIDGQTLTTNKNGKTGKSKKLKAGTYSLKETQAPDGFKKMSPNPKNVKIIANKTTKFTIKDQPEIPYATISVEKKIEDGTPEESATFKIWPQKYGKYSTKASWWDKIPSAVKTTITTDANGKVTSKKLPAECAVFDGKYYIHQTKAPSKSLKKISNEKITLPHKGGTVKWSAVDTVEDSYIEKVDAKSEETVQEEGIEFRVKKKGAFRRLQRIINGEDKIDQKKAKFDKSSETECNVTLEVKEGEGILEDKYLNADGNLVIEVTPNGGKLTKAVYNGEELSVYNNKMIVENPIGDVTVEVYFGDGEEDSLGTPEPMDKEDAEKVVDAFLSDDPVAELNELGVEFEDAAWQNLGTKNAFTTNDKGIATIEDIGSEQKGSYEIYETKSPEEFKLPGYKLSAVDPDNASALDYPVDMVIGNSLAFYASYSNMPLPEIGTTAIDGATNESYGVVGENSTIIDTVTLNNLEKDKVYTLVGTLMDKETGEPVKDADGKPIKVLKTYTAKGEETESTEVTFTFDSTIVRGKDVVVFEKLYEGEYEEEPESEELAKHEDINDDGQTITYPDGYTKAIDEDTNSQLGNPKEEATLIDTFHYKNLNPNATYKVVGKLYDKETGEPLLIDGKEVTAESEEFSPDKANEEPEDGDDDETTEEEETEEFPEGEGEVDVEFKFDASSLQGKTIVVYEELKIEDLTVLTHFDLNDDWETIYYPDIQTLARDNSTGEHMAKYGEKVKIIDTVSYRNLIPDKEYTISGTLYDKATEAPLVLEEGKSKADNDTGAKTATGSATFTPKTSDGEVEVEFEFDSTAVHGKTTVVFETLYYKDLDVAYHQDIEDEGQTIYFPEIKTKATDKKSGTKKVEPSKVAKVVDSVKYTNLTPDREYTVSGTLYVKETGKPLTINGKKVTSSRKFTPKKSSGEVKIIFTFDARALQGKKLVAFEKVKYNKVTVAVHEDIDDNDQTVVIKKNPNPPVERENTQTGDMVMRYLIMLILGIGVMGIAYKFRRN